jgi:hypothetical protein
LRLPLSFHCLIQAAIEWCFKKQSDTNFNYYAWIYMHTYLGVRSAWKRPASALHNWLQILKPLDLMILRSLN